LQPDFRVLFFLGLAPLIIAGLVKQRFEVQYKGRRLRLVNSVYEAERLYVDGTLLASGGFGRLVELRATIPEGAGAGDQIRATAFAGVFSFGCRIFVAETAVPAQVINPSVAPNAGPDAVPAPFLARGRRGSRWTTFFWFGLAIAALVVVGGVDVETGPGEMNLRHDFANLVALALIGNSLFFALRRGPAPSPPVDSPVRRPQAHAATPTPR